VISDSRTDLKHRGTSDIKAKAREVFQAPQIVTLVVEGPEGSFGGHPATAELGKHYSS